MIKQIIVFLLLILLVGGFFVIILFKWMLGMIIILCLCGIGLLIGLWFVAVDFVETYLD